MKIRPQVRPASRGADEGWAVLSTLISGFVVFGGIGWLLDHWWDTHLMVPIGLIVGMALSIYAVVMQFGRPDAAGSDAVSQREQAAPAARSATAAAALRTEKALNRARAVEQSTSARHDPHIHPTTGHLRPAPEGRPSVSEPAFTGLAGSRGGRRVRGAVGRAFVLLRQDRRRHRHRVRQGDGAAGPRHPAHHGLHAGGVPENRDAARQAAVRRRGESTDSSATASRSRSSAARTAANGPVS